MPTNRQHLVIASIREFKRAVPFKPFKICMTGGETFKVSHPDYVGIPPKGSFVISVDADEHPYHLSSLLIESVSQCNGHRSRKGGKRR
jgi:hypothetical protein